MARIKLTDDLKKAISGMSPAQKDKLLFRLIAGNPPLAEKLIFDLLEGGDTQGERRTEVANEIRKTLTTCKEDIYSPGILLLYLRDLSGIINRHVATTKDKYGEVELNLLMLNTAFEEFAQIIRNSSPLRARTFNEYVVKRVLKLLSLIDKLHEDLHLDFKDEFKKLGKQMSLYPPIVRLAADLHLDVKDL